MQVVLAIGKMNLLQHLKNSQPRGNRDRELNFVHALRDGDNPQKMLERKVDLAIEGGKEAQQKLYQAEVEIEAKNWEKRNRDHSFQEINQVLESQRFQLHQASRWTDQASRDKFSPSGESELRNRLFQESHARDCQEIEELRRICCEETAEARQARIEELSLHQQRNPTTVSQMMA